MDFPTWHEELRIGIEAVDQQHKMMMADIRHIDDAVVTHQSRTEVIHRMNKLLTDSELHFRDEDILMLNQNYPAINEHVRQHELFIGRLHDLKITYSPSEIETVHRELVDIEAWFVKHILEYDKLYMEHMYV